MPPQKFEAMEPTAGQQLLRVKCGAGDLEIAHRWERSRNTVTALTFWKRSLDAGELALVNVWLEELRSPAVVMTWCNTIGADMIFEEAYGRVGGPRKRVRIFFAHGRLTRG